MQALQAGCDVLFDAQLPARGLRRRPGGCAKRHDLRGTLGPVSIKSCCTSSNLHRRAAGPLAAANSRRNKRGTLCPTPSGPLTARFLPSAFRASSAIPSSCLAALDRIVPPGFVEIVTPPGVETPHYTNIKVVSFGTHRGGVWQQLDYPRYLRQRGAGGLATCNVIPLFGFRGIAVVHDVCYRARPDFYTDPAGG